MDEEPATGGGPKPETLAFGFLSLVVGAKPVERLLRHWQLNVVVRVLVCGLVAALLFAGLCRAVGSWPRRLVIIAIGLTCAALVLTLHLTARWGVRL